MHLRSLSNGGMGHCWLEVVAQAYAIEKGWGADLVERAFSAGESERLFSVRTALRHLTIKVFNLTENPLILEGFGGPRTAFNQRDIRRLALNFRQDVTNADDFRDTVLYMDADGGGGGHGGTRAILALSEGLGIDLGMGPSASVLEEYVDGATWKCAAIHDGGHWALVALSGKNDDEATKVGSESDVLDFVEERINSSLAELATRTGDGATSAVDGTKPHDIDVGIDTDSGSSTAPPSLSSSRGDATPDDAISTGDDSELRGTTETADPPSPNATPDPIPESTAPSSPRDDATPDPIPGPSSPTSSRTSRTSHSWGDDEYWDDYQNYLDHNSFFIEEVFIEEVCLFPSVWREWTRGPEEVCLFPSVWSEWTRTQPRKHGKVRGSRGRRTTTRKNKKRRFPRRRQDRRRRAALRRKRLARRARVGGRRRRPRTCFLRGGAYPEQDGQVTGEDMEQETKHGSEATGAPATPAPPAAVRRSNRAGRGENNQDPDACTSILDAPAHAKDPRAQARKANLVKVSGPQGPTYVPHTAAGVPGGGGGGGSKSKATSVPVGGGGGKRKAAGVAGGGTKHKATRVAGDGSKRKATGVAGGGTNQAQATKHKATRVAGDGGVDAADGGDTGVAPMEVGDDSDGFGNFGAGVGGGNWRDSDGNDSEGGGAGCGGGSGSNVSGSEWEDGSTESRRTDVDSGGGSGNGGNGGSGGSGGSSGSGGSGNGGNGGSGGSGGSSGNGGNSSGSDDSDSDGGGNSSGSDDSDSDGGSGGGRGRGSGGSNSDDKDGGEKFGHQVRVNSTQLSDWMTKAVRPCLEPFIRKNRELAAERAKKHEGSAPHTKGRPAGVGTVADLAGPISLLTKDKKNGFEVFKGIFSPISNIDLLSRHPDSLSGEEKNRFTKTKRLRDHYNLDFVFYPSDIDVKLGRTEVELENGTIQKVNSFVSGSYILEDGKTRINQWELLQHRRGKGVKLIEDVARYIRQLAHVHTMAYVTFVPFISNGNKTMWNGMLLDVDGGTQRAKASGDKIDHVSKLRLDELEAIKTKTERVRQFSLEIFTEASVQDLLPRRSKSSSGKKKGATEEFIERAGSLKELNFMPGLKCSNQPGVLSGHLFTGKVARGGTGWVPSEKENKLGSWPAKLTVLIRACMCAYRLGRPSNIVEAFHPLSPKELEVLRSTHPFWDKNMEESFEDADFDAMSTHVTGKDGLAEHEWAYRLVVERSKTFYTYLTPVIVNACGTRDPYRYGSLALNGLDTNHVSHTRCYDFLLDKAMKGSASLEIVKDVLKECEGIFQTSRNGRDSRNADIGGALGGEGRKSRRDRVILEPDRDDDRKFTLLMAFQVSLGEKVRPMMEKVMGLCPDFDTRAATCLKDAALDSGSFSKVCGEKHLLGDNGKKWIDEVVDGLDSMGVSCQDWCRFSVATQFGCLFNAACLREKSALNLAANTTYYNNERGRVSMRPPAKEKQSKTANKKAWTVLKEHEIHGADVVRWVMVMNLVGRAFFRKKTGAVDASFGPLGSNGKHMKPDTFGKIFREVMRAYFGVDNADVYALRTAQDSQAMRDLLAVGANTDHPALAELSREQRTGKENISGAYCTYQFDRVAKLLLKDDVYLDFKGGLRRMAVEKRKREGKPEFPDSPLWRIAEFVELVREMMAMEPPKAPEEVINELGDDYEPDPNSRAPMSMMNIDPESHDGFVPPPPSGGASYGGPSYTIDAEEAEMAKRIRMKRMELEEEEIDAKRAARANQALSSVPAAVGGVATAATSYLSGTARQVSGQGDDSGESSKSVSGSRRGMSYNKPASLDECNGIQELARGVGEAWKEAKKKGVEDEVYKKMNSKRMKTATLPLVRYLEDEYKGFKPGDWFPSSKFAKVKSQTGFNRKIKEVQKQVSGWTWCSWKN